MRDNLWKSPQLKLVDIDHICCYLNCAALPALLLCLLPNNLFFTLNFNMFATVSSKFFVLSARYNECQVFLNSDMPSEYLILNLLTALKVDLVLQSFKAIFYNSTLDCKMFSYKKLNYKTNYQSSALLFCPFLCIIYFSL